MGRVAGEARHGLLRPRVEDAWTERMAELTVALVALRAESRSRGLEERLLLRGVWLVTGRAPALIRLQGVDGEGRVEQVLHVGMAAQAEIPLLALDEPRLVGGVRRVAGRAARVQGLVRSGRLAGDLHRRVAADAELRFLGEERLRFGPVHVVALVAVVEDLVGLRADEARLIGPVGVVARGAVGVREREPPVPLHEARALRVVALGAEAHWLVQELVSMSRRMGGVAGRAVALGEGLVDGGRGEESLLGRVTGEAEFASGLQEARFVFGRVGAVAFHALARPHRRVDLLLFQLFGDALMARETCGSARSLHEVFFSGGMGRVAFDAEPRLGRGVDERALLVAVREVRVARLAELKALRVQGCGRSGLARRRVASGAIALL